MLPMPPGKRRFAAPITPDLVYTSAVLKGSVFATQFHPEKSSRAGLEIYRNWLTSLGRCVVK